MQKIITLMCALVLGACSITPEKACEICMSVSPCTPPPELDLIPQGALTLPPPRATLVTPEEGKPYFEVSQKDFYLWLDNNHQLEEYILECRSRTDMVKDYYEKGIQPLRLRDSLFSSESKD